VSQTVDSLFETGLERYKAEEEPATLIPVFKEICARAPKSSAAWACLAWLYLLDNKGTQAYKAAQKAVKYIPRFWARVNLAVAMLETGQPGVRQHVDLAMQLIMVDSEMRDEIKQSIEDGLNEWKSLKRVKTWLF